MIQTLLSMFDQFQIIWEFILKNICKYIEYYYTISRQFYEHNNALFPYKATGDMTFINGVKPAQVLLKTHYFLVINNIYPEGYQHWLIITRDPNIRDITMFQLKHWIALGIILVCKIDKVTGGLSGCKIVHNIGKSAGQSVQHFHMHIIYKPYNINSIHK
jgi:hypothetical protein